MILTAATATMSSSVSVSARHTVDGQKFLSGKDVAPSHFITPVPAVVYQTIRDGKSQNGATPLVLRLKLSSEATASFTSQLRAKQPLSSLVYCALRRFDLAELELYNAATQSMLGLRLSQAMFEYEFAARDSVLTVYVHRKELPVSANYGDAPYVFVFRLVPTGELVVSTPFHVASKEAEVKAPRSVPKRKRLPSARLPTFSHAVGDEAIITQALFTGPVTLPLPPAPDTKTEDVLSLEPVKEGEGEDECNAPKKSKLCKSPSTSSVGDLIPSPSSSGTSGDGGDVSGLFQEDLMAQLLADNTELTDLPYMDDDEFDAALMEGMLALE